MFDENASDSNARAEQGRKNNDFREFYESVKMDIRNEANAGNNKTTYVVPKNKLEFVDSIVETLTGENYSVQFEASRPSLKISWEEA